MLALFIILGLFLGNFVTSFYCRIANKQPISGLNNLGGKKPYCLSCGHSLKFYEYFPIVSLLSTKFSFSCNYCKSIFPKIYTVIEISVGLIFGLNYLMIKNDQLLSLMSLYSPLLVLLIALELKEKHIPSFLIFTSCVLGIVFRTLIDKSFYIWLLQILAFFLFFLARYNKKNFELSKFINKFLTILIACCWLSEYGLITFLAIIIFLKAFKLKSNFMFAIELVCLYFIIIVSQIGIINV